MAVSSSSTPALLLLVVLAAFLVCFVTTTTTATATTVRLGRHHHKTVDATTDYEVRKEEREHEMRRRAVGMTQTGSNVPAGGNVLPLGIYYAVVELGTPARYFNVCIDTGSADLLVPQSACDGCTASPAHTYDPSNSTTSTPIYCDNTFDYACHNASTPSSLCVTDPSEATCTFKNSYQTCDLNDPTKPCTVSGPMWSDVFTIGEYTSRVTFGTITLQTSNFEQFAIIDGVMGVASQNISGLNAVPPISQLAEDGLISNILALCLLEEGGVMTIGGVDSSLYTGNISYTPLVYGNVTNQTGLYDFNMLDFLVDDVSIGVDPSVYNEALSCIDSGTNGVLLPPSAFTALQNTVTALCENTTLHGVCDVLPNATIFDGQCFNYTQAQLEEFPEFTMVIEGVKLTFDATRYMVNPNGPSEGMSPLCFEIYSSGTVDRFTILGDIVMQNYYSIFDLENHRLGFAPVNETACAAAAL